MIGDGDNETIKTLKGEIEDVTRNKMISEHAYGKELIRVVKENESLKVLLREADCPNDAFLIDGFHYCCDEGELFSILNTDKLLGPCEWCKNRTALLGDEK